MFEKIITRKFLGSLRHIECGMLKVTTPDGLQHVFAGSMQGETATLTIHDWRAARQLVQKGDAGFAAAYRDGWWDSDDLAALFKLALRNDKVLNQYIYGGSLGQIFSRIAYMFTRNTLRGSKENIHAHYDLGNKFYALWLDPSMTYSSALYKSSGDDLVGAQHNKYDRIIERLGASGKLLEIGCGWGGFADRALQFRDYALKGLTISQEQHAFAVQRLNGSAEIALEDYRLQQGVYDNIVSIEMFEAVGEQYWPVYFGKIKSLLSQKGRALIQTIVIGNDYFDRYRRSGDAVRSFIFPGGMLPSPQRFDEEACKAGLRLTDRYDFGQDYARTLESWHNNFESKLHEVRQLGFDEPFIRMWRFYLTSCIATFAVGRTDVMQVELQHA